MSPRVAKCLPRAEEFLYTSPMVRWALTSGANRATARPGREASDCRADKGIMEMPRPPATHCMIVGKLAALVADAVIDAVVGPVSSAACSLKSCDGSCVLLCWLSEA